MKQFIFALFVLEFGDAPSANEVSAFHTGTKLLEFCNAPRGNKQAGACRAYLAAIFDINT